MIVLYFYFPDDKRFPSGRPVMCHSVTRVDIPLIDSELAAKYLEVSKEYTVDYSEIFDLHTKVYLKEFPGIEFNSLVFEKE